MRDAAEENTKPDFLPQTSLKTVVPAEMGATHRPNRTSNLALVGPNCSFCFILIWGYFGRCESNENTVVRKLVGLSPRLSDQGV